MKPAAMGGSTGPLITLLILAILVAACIGRYPITPDLIARLLGSLVFPVEKTWSTAAETALFQVRLPRIGVALLVGAALAGSGATFQGVFRNPLVSPFILGVSAGAGFGAAIAILLGGGTLAIQFSAFAFGGVAVLGSILLGRIYSSNPTLVLVLAGIIVGGVFAALLSLLKYTADPENRLPIIEYWLLGSLSGARQSVLIGLALLILPAMALALALRWRLNLLVFGDETAASLGVNTRRERLIHIALATVMASGAVAVCGIVGWVGLVVPHLGRLLVGPDHVRLMPATFLIGAIFMLVVDTLARSISSSEIPLGVMTALVGAPVFAILLRRGERSWM
ncbi:MAG: FecCD family ABC transporter permease [Paracoccus sp. (in: a-proteobacteria)]